MSKRTLPVHPLTGARALGWRKARPGEDVGPYPIWPVLGGAEDEDDDQDGAEDQDDDAGDDGQGDVAADGVEDDDSDPQGADKLRDPGKRALASMKGKWRAERDRRRALEQQLAGRDSGGSGDSGEDAGRQQQAEQAALAKANGRILRAEVRAVAAGKLADPKDALSFLDLEQFEVGDDGEIDSEEIADAIDELISRKPYLAAAPVKRFQGTGDGGAARKAGKPKQLSRDDVKRMSPEQIVKAKSEGRLDDVLGITR